MEENKDYHAYRYGDHLTPGSELKIEHSVVCENVDISTLITMGTDSLEAMRQGSIDGEQKAYEIVVAAAKQWEQQAAATQTINRALEYTQLKDESEWFKIPNHHPAIVSVDLFEKANASIKRFSLSNKKPRDYLLRGKVFCGCCDHAMSLRNGAWFYCRHSEVAETLPCHGVRIKMADLEQVVFETIRAQMCPALGIDSNKDKLDLQTVQQAEHEEKLRSIQDSKRHLYEQYALGEIDLETYRTRKAVYDTELVQAKNVHAVITAQTKQIKSDYEIKLKQQEIVQEVGNANMLTKALIDRLINKVYVFPGDRIEIEYATQDFLETKQSEKEV